MNKSVKWENLLWVTPFIAVLGMIWIDCVYWTPQKEIDDYSVLKKYKGYDDDLDIKIMESLNDNKIIRNELDEIESFYYLIKFRKQKQK